MTPGQTLYTCPFCKISYQVNAPPPPMAAPPMPFGFQQPYQQQIPHVVIGQRRGYRSSSSGLVWFSLALPILIVGFVMMMLYGHGIFAGAWSGKETLECSGNDDMTVSGVTATIEGDTVISATGNCMLHVKQCNLKGATGIEAGGNAHVIVEQGTVEGSESAIDASGNAHVELHGTKVTGPKTRGGNAKIVGP